MKLVGWQTTGGQRRHYRAGARHGFNPQAGLAHGLDHALTWITNSGTAGICDQRNLFAAAETFQDLLAPFCFVELKITEHRPGNLEMPEEQSGPSRILGRHDVALFERA